MLLRRLACLLAVVFTVLVCLSREGRAEGGAEAAKRIAPLVDQNTVAVGHLDLARWDVKATFALARELKGEEHQPGEAQLVTAIVDGLKTAGVRELYLVVSLDDLSAVPPLVAVPLAPGGNEAAVTTAVKTMPPAMAWSTARVGELLVLGTAERVARARSMKPVQRADLAAALVAGGDATARLALLPPAHLERVVDELLPPPPDWGGLAPAPLVRATRWATIAVHSPPGTKLAIEIGARDAAAARQLDGELHRAAERIIQQRLPRPDERHYWEQVAAGVRREVSGESVRWSIDDLPPRRNVSALVRPLIQAARRAAYRNASAVNLHQIGLALLKYEAARDKGALPPAFVASPAGKPLLSWRVLILPYLDQQALFAQFRLDEPWDSPHNRPLLAKMPGVFRDPSSPAAKEHKTVYLAVRSREAVFSGAEGMQLKHITDGMSRTLMVVEVDESHAAPWTKPDDRDFDAAKPAAGLGGHYPGVFLALSADAAVRVLRTDAPGEVLHALFTRSGNEPTEVDEALAH